MHPVTIENGAGERLTFVRVETGSDGSRVLIVTNEVQPGAGPPMHVHYRQTESLTVREGRLGYQFDGGPEQFASVGETVTFEAGRAHRFWAAENNILKCDGWVSPPDNLQYFLTQIYESTKRNGGKKPDDFDAAWLLYRYRSEFGMSEIPRFVQNFVFPIVRLVGRLQGKHKRFADAPSPIG